MKIVNLFFGNYLRAGMFVIIAVIGWFCWHFLNTHSFVSDKELRNYKKQEIECKDKITGLDSTIFSLTQTIDIKAKTDTEFQIVIKRLNGENKQLKIEIKRLDEALGHYEENGLMRFFVLENKLFKRNECYKEVFEKPKNICQ